jgi:hypothetical protein
MIMAYELYRYRNQDGSSKDWAVCANADGSYTSRWGKTGSKLQSKTFKNMLPMQDHIRSKTNKGYTYVGRVDIDDSGHVKTISSDSSSATTAAIDPHPTQDDPLIYWRIRINSSHDTDIAVPFLQGQFTAFAQHILNAFPDCHWVQRNYNGRDFIKTGAGSLRVEDGIGSLLLLMATKKAASAGISVTLSHDDSVDISDQLKLEPQALSFFDTDLESVRSIAETIGLLEKRLDLAMVETKVGDFYFD